MKIVYILGEFPSNSEYFIQHEIAKLEERGIDIYINALKRAGQNNDCNKPGKALIYQKIYSVENMVAYGWYLFHHPTAMGKTLVKALFARQSFMELLRNLKAFHVGVFFTYKLRKLEYQLIHAHFLSYPALVAGWMSELVHIPLSLAAHAQDIHLGKRLEKKISQALFVITCNHYNKAQLLPQVGMRTHLSEKIHVVYHGIDLAFWTTTRMKAGSRLRNEPIEILSIARLVNKKGLIYLLQAVKLLVSKGVNVNCKIVGEGPLYRSLDASIREYHLNNCVFLMGAKSQTEIRDLFALTDVFVLPCIIADNRDQDGLPNVLLESLAMQVPVITTPVAAIGELIHDKETGLLIPQKDPKAIAESIQMLSDSPDLYKRLQQNGRKLVEEKFNIDKSTDQLVDIFNFSK